jgi:uncharacterized protein (TIGR02246 family)
METLRGRVVVVTGAGNGIGAALARRFAAEGAHLVLADVEAATLDSVRREMDERGVEVLAKVTDVASYASVEELAVAAQERFGAVHVVCNNAGISTSGRSVADLALEDWRWSFDVNVFGAVHGIHAFLPLVLQQDEGHFLQTASSAAFGGAAYNAPYSATKAALLNLSESLYRELVARGARVGVSVILPGAVLTTIGRSEDRRPPQHRRPDDRPPEHTPAAELDRVAALRAQGIEAADVAATAIEAIRTNRFYVFTNPGTEAVAVRRTDDILAGRNPSSPAATSPQDASTVPAAPDAEDAVRSLLAQYCQLVDARRFDDLADLFTEGAELAIDDREQQGRSSIRAFMDSWPIPEVPTRHVVVNSVVQVSGTTAAASSDQMVVFATAEGGMVKRVARCEDTFVETEGRWRFATRRQTVTSFILAGD